MDPPGPDIQELERQGDIAGLIDALRHPEPATGSAAAEALRRAASAGKAGEVVRQGGLEVLVAALEGDNWMVQDAAAGALEEIVKSGEALERVETLGIPALLESYHSAEEEEEMEFLESLGEPGRMEDDVARQLGKWTRELFLEPTKTRIGKVEVGGNYREDGDETTTGGVCWTTIKGLRRRVETYDARDVVRAGTLEHIVRAVELGRGRARVDALRCVRSLVRRGEAKPVMRSGGTAAVLDALGDPGENVREEAARTLKQMVDAGRYRELVEAGGCKRLVETLPAEGRCAQRMVLEAIRAMARAGQARPLMDAGAVSPLVNLVREPDVLLSPPAADTLRVFAGSGLRSEELDLREMPAMLDEMERALGLEVIRRVGAGERRGRTIVLKRKDEAGEPWGGEEKGEDKGELGLEGAEEEEGEVEGEDEAQCPECGALVPITAVRCHACGEEFE